MTIKELIAKLEAATEGSRELDAEICIALGLNEECETVGAGWKEPPHYTRSIDAALSLVPDNVFITLDRYSISEIQPDPYAWRCWAKWHEGDFSSDNSKPLFQREAFSGTKATPALALCIACLKAREKS